MYAALDVIEYLMSTTGGGAQDQEHRVLRQALFHAYRDLVVVREWRWHHTVDRVPISGLVNTHVLPWGVQSVDAMLLTEPDALAEYITPVEWDREMNDANGVEDFVGCLWTVAPSKSFPDRFEVRVLNGQYVDQTATLTYRRRPRDLRLTGWEPASRAGRISWAGTEVTGEGTSFNGHMVGSILRVSDDSAYHPESLAGMHPYTDECLIASVNSPTSMTVWSPSGAMPHADTKFVVTDYLDISPGMYTALLSGCEVWMSRLLGKNIEGAFQVYNRDLRLAFESDAVAPLSGRSSGGSGGCGCDDFWFLRPGVDQGLPTYGVGGPNEEGTCAIKPDVYGGASDSLYDGCGEPR
jgi:hypothetical protein